MTGKSKPEAAPESGGDIVADEPEVTEASADVLTEPVADEGVVIEWVGYPEDHSHVRKISGADFASVGVLDQVDITWDRTDPLTRGQAKVSKRAAEFLTEIEKGFATVADEDRSFKFR